MRKTVDIVGQPSEALTSKHSTIAQAKGCPTHVRSLCRGAFNGLDKLKANVRLAKVGMLLEPAVPENLPFLKAICWQTDDVKLFTPKEMLHRYERGWHYKGVLGVPSAEEQAFIKQMAQRYGSWLLVSV